MSSPAFIDVRLEVPTSQLIRAADPTRELWELMRTEADAQCAEVGATLRTDRTPEVIVKQAHSVIVGDMTLIASRWAIDAPDSLTRTL